MNDAVYIAKSKEGKWEATGKQFQVPYVFKTMFSHEPLIFSDFCETKSVTKGDIFLDFDGDVIKTGMQDLVTEGIVKQDDIESFTSGKQFIGRVGQFTPMKHGGRLVRKVGEKYHAVTGTKRPNGDP